MHRPLVALLATAVLVATLGSPVAAVPGSADATDGAGAPTASRGCGGPTGAAVQGDGANVSVDTLVAPGFTYDRLRNASAMRAAAAQGLLVPAVVNAAVDRSGDLVATGDVVVHRIRFTGDATAVLDRMAAQERGSPTADFRAFVAAAGVDFYYNGPGLCPPRLVLNETVDRGALRAVPDERNDTLYLVADADGLVFERGDERSVERWAHGFHSMSLVLHPESGLVASMVEAEAEYQVTHPRATFTATGHDPHLTLDAAPGREVGGRTTVAAGRTLTVVLTLANGSATTRTVRVHSHREAGDPSRHYHATFDLSDVPEGTGFTVRVRRGDTVVGETNGTVRNATASVTLPAREQWDDEAIRLASVTLSDGGFVRVTDGEGITFGTTQYLAPGTHQDVTVPLDTADHHRLSPSTEPTAVVYVHRDSNDNRLFDRWTDGADPVYMADGAVVRAEAPIGTPTPTPTASPSPTATETPDRATVTTPDGPTASPTPTATGSPGFGPLAALVALVAAGVLGARDRCP